MSEATRRKLAAMLADGKAPKKDRPGLVDDAARLAEAGRRGDKMIAHITPEEAALLHARGGSGTINPRTGLLEFYDSSYDGGGQGNQDAGFGGGGFASDTTGGGGVTTPGEQLADALARGDQVDFSVQGFGGTTPGEQLADALERDYQPRGFMERFGDWASRQVANKVYDVVNNPITNLIDIAVPGVPGLINTVSGLAGGKTLGGLITSGVRSATNYEGADNALGADKPGGDKDSPLSGDNRGSEANNPASGTGGPLSQQTSALAQALAGNTPLNQGRKTFGSLVDSFDPNGRRYVSPWASRG